MRNLRLVLLALLVVGCLTRCRTKSVVQPEQNISNNVEIVPDSFHIVLADSSLFEHNSSVLSLRGRKLLVKEFAYLPKRQLSHLDIGGHVHLASNEKLNQRLSYYRAQSIAVYLTDSLALSSKEFRCIGYGSSKTNINKPDAYTHISLSITNNQ